MELCSCSVVSQTVCVCACVEKKGEREVRKSRMQTSM